VRKENLKYDLQASRTKKVAKGTKVNERIESKLRNAEADG